MDFLKRLFGESQSLPDQADEHYVPFRIRFDDGQTAVAVRAPVAGDPNRILAALRLSPPRPALFISGGAGLMSAEDAEATRPVIDDGLARFCEKHGVALFDGGTQTGVMALTGEAHDRRGYRFPLVGVAPAGAVCYPGYQPTPDAAPLDTGHTHFVLTDGDAFGQESAMITALAWASAGRGQQRVAGILINGGEISRQETYARFLADNLNVPLIVLEGSGRFADEMARALLGEDSTDIRIPAILKNADVRVASIHDGPEALYRLLAAALGREGV